MPKWHLSDCCWKASVLPEIGSQAAVTIGLAAKNFDHWTAPVLLWGERQPAIFSGSERSKNIRHCLIVGQRLDSVRLDQKWQSDFFYLRNKISTVHAPYWHGRIPWQALPTARLGHTYTGTRQPLFCPRRQYLVLLIVLAIAYICRTVPFWHLPVPVSQNCLAPAWFVTRSKDLNRVAPCL